MAGIIQAISKDLLDTAHSYHNSVDNPRLGRPTSTSTRPVDPYRASYASGIDSGNYIRDDYIQDVLMPAIEKIAKTTFLSRTASITLRNISSGGLIHVIRASQPFP